MINENCFVGVDLVAKMSVQEWTHRGAGFNTTKYRHFRAPENLARVLVLVAGDIKLMPGTASDPAFRKIDVDVHTGKVTGLF